MTEQLVLILENDSELAELINNIGTNGPIPSIDYNLPDEWTPFIDESEDEYGKLYFDLTHRGRTIFNEISKQ